MSTSPIIARFPLQNPWRTADPFLFCVHHQDHYPQGDAKMAPKASLVGRQIGADFSGKDGWSMYHGEQVPGFPGHPHRGFETVTIVRSGYVDHSDSLGATARFGPGDVQWLTTGKGIVHSEMFPLVNQDRDNPLELFQIWLNLPARSKMVEPHFSMFWREQIPTLTHTDERGLSAQITVIAGALPGADAPLSPPPHSWAASAEAEVAIWSIALSEGASWTLPAASKGVHRTLSLFAGASTRVAQTLVQRGTGLQLVAEREVTLVNEGDSTAELLLLQGRPLNEPVAQHGPFVMNTRAELQQAMMDYQRTRFGGWPWGNASPTHARERGRFAIHGDGREETR